MDAVTFWLLLYLTQGKGLQVNAFGTLEECKNEKLVVEMESLTLAVSECQEMAMTPIKGEAKSGRTGGETK